MLTLYSVGDRYMNLAGIGLFGDDQDWGKHFCHIVSNSFMKLPGNNYNTEFQDMSLIQDGWNQRNNINVLTEKMYTYT